MPPETAPGADSGASTAAPAAEATVTVTAAENGAGTVAGQAPATEDGQGKAPTFDGEFDAEKAARLVANTRAERDAEKAKRSQVEGTLAAIAKALGLDDGESKPDPEALTRQLTEAQDAQRVTRVELAVYRMAAKAGADPDALLDSRSFLDAVKDLDPSAETFADSVKAAISEAVKGNERLKAPAAVAPRAGVPLQGGPAGAPNRPTSLEEAVAARLSS